VFIVEWLKGAETVKREAMLGAHIDDVLRVAHGDAEKIQCDAIRVKNAATGETSIHPATPNDP